MREGIGELAQILGRHQWQVCQTDQHGVTGLLQRTHATVHRSHLPFRVIVIAYDAQRQAVQQFARGLLFVADDHHQLPQSCLQKRLGSAAQQRLAGHRQGQLVD